GVADRRPVRRGRRGRPVGRRDRARPEGPRARAGVRARLARRADPADLAFGIGPPDRPERGFRPAPVPRLRPEGGARAPAGGRADLGPEPGAHPSPRGGGAVIEVENLTKNYEGHWAVRGVSFAVAEGDIFGFIGPNGAGKTTSIRIISTLLDPTSG